MVTKVLRLDVDCIDVIQSYSAGGSLSDGVREMERRIKGDMVRRAELKGVVEKVIHPILHPDNPDVAKDDFASLRVMLVPFEADIVTGITNALPLKGERRKKTKVKAPPEKSWFEKWFGGEK
jgi:hypothetical protein